MTSIFLKFIANLWPLTQHNYSSSFLMMSEFLNAVISIWQFSMTASRKDFCTSLHMIEISWVTPYLWLFSGCTHLANDAVSLQRLGGNYLFLHFSFSWKLKCPKKRSPLYNQMASKGETFFDIGYLYLIFIGKERSFILKLIGLVHLLWF